jgi:hypothetical protein
VDFLLRAPKDRNGSDEEEHSRTFQDVHQVPSELAGLPRQADLAATVMNAPDCRFLLMDALVWLNAMIPA